MPIPITLLPDTVIYKEFESDGRYGKTYKEPTILSSVRVEETTSKERSQYTDDTIHSHVLFYDVVNSKSTSPFEFKKDSIIEYNGQELTVKKVMPIVGFQLHHYEIELI